MDVCTGEEKAAIPTGLVASSRGYPALPCRAFTWRPFGTASRRRMASSWTAPWLSIRNAKLLSELGLKTSARAALITYSSSQSHCLWSF